MEFDLTKYRPDRRPEPLIKLTEKELPPAYQKMEVGEERKINYKGTKQKDAVYRIKRVV